MNCCINGAYGPTEFGPPSVRLSWDDATEVATSSPTPKPEDAFRWMTPERLVGLLQPILNEEEPTPAQWDFLGELEATLRSRRRLRGPRATGGAKIIDFLRFRRSRTGSKIGYVGTLGC